jgi:hypothetical protein
MKLIFLRIGDLALAIGIGLFAVAISRSLIPAYDVLIFLALAAVLIMNWVFGKRRGHPAFFALILAFDMLGFAAAFQQLLSERGIWIFVGICIATALGILYVFRSQVLKD